MTKNVEMKWVVTKGKENVSIKLLSFCSDIRGPMWDRDRGSEFRKFRVGLEQVSLGAKGNIPSGYIVS